MGYPAEFKPEHLVILNEMIGQVSNLRPTESLIIEHTDHKALALRKYLLYAWLSPQHTNQKELFRIQMLSRRSMLIIRLDNSPAKITHRIALSECEDFVCKHLLETSDADEAIGVITQHKLSPALATQVFEEWQRKCATENQS